MGKYLLKNGLIINRGISFYGDVLINNDRIERVDANIEDNGATEINCEGKWIMPGIIDDQVHFREPGLTHKANIGSESRAAVAGGITSFMEMPNTKPSALTQELLQDKYDIAAKTSLANYSFFMGASNDNIEEVLKTNEKDVCGVKIFMGSSTGNMLVDNQSILEGLFSRVPMLIATHCEDEETIRTNAQKIIGEHGEDIDASFHPIIRNTDGCYISSSKAIEMAKRHGTRLHILHISTEKELDLFRNDIPLAEKKITAEVCVHHLYFNADDYAEYGNKIKCNPAIKAKSNQDALFAALLDDRLDIIATDHAPHTWEEKSQPYLKAPSGVPLVQHSLNIMLDFYHKGMISKEKMIEKMCHAPSELFGVVGRGYLDEGSFADIAIVDPNQQWTVNKKNILYKCGWSPLEGKTLTGGVTHTFVNGHLAFNYGQMNEDVKGSRLVFR